MESPTFYQFDKIPIREPMTRETFNTKWDNKPVDDMSDEELVEFKNDCFLLYETYGFSDTYYSPYDDEWEHNGMKFDVLRRATTKEVDLEAMPIWLVKFENGDEAYCYPEEITTLEHNKL